MEKIFWRWIFIIKIQIREIKSDLLKIIFSFLNERIKLKLIINNKFIQKKLEFNIENYKQISNRYKIYLCKLFYNSY